MWSEEAVTLLRTKWTEGLSASQISRALREELRLSKSRNAVIGKVHRIGLAGRAHVKQVKKNPRRTKAAKACYFGPPAQRVQAVERLPNELASIRAMAPLDPKLDVHGLSAFTCRHPIGDPKLPGFAFCGRTCGADEPYCCDHARLNYAAPKHVAKLRRSSERLARWMDQQSRSTAAVL